MQNSNQMESSVDRNRMFFERIPPRGGGLLLALFASSSQDAFRLRFNRNT